jgi:hypothetical protein
MIISHRHRFIFLKTKKTGGSSVELALSEICGPQDVLLPIGEGGEDLRKGRPPQNMAIPPEYRRALWRLRQFLPDKRRPGRGIRYENHMQARDIRASVDPAVWSSYLKVSIERNPWDREVSRYYYKKRPEKRAPFENFVKTYTCRKPNDNFDIYGIDGVVVADVVLRHASLASDFERLVRERFGIGDPPQLPHAKSGYRPTTEYRSLYSAELRDLVGRIYRREIDHFGFEF